MTEEEAKKKTCPFNMVTLALTLTYLRVSGMEDDGIERMGEIQSKCGASDCAMWASDHCGLIK